VKAVRNQQTGKQEIVHAGLMPVCERDFMFEMTFSLMLHPDAPGLPHPLKISDTFKGAFPTGQTVTERAGEYLRAWSTGEASDPETARLWMEARSVASQGKVAFAEYWKGLSGEQRGALRIITNDLKSACATADSRAESEAKAHAEFEDDVVTSEDEDVNAPF
jgi:hypothetical protein